VTCFSSAIQHARQRALPACKTPREVWAYVSIRQHTSAYVSIGATCCETTREVGAYVSIRQHPSAYVGIRQHTSAYVSIRQHTRYVPARRRARWGEGVILQQDVGRCRQERHRRKPTYVSIRQHTSAYVTIRQHTLGDVVKSGTAGNLYLRLY
jgi:hypothetical protein